MERYTESYHDPSRVSRVPSFETVHDTVMVSPAAADAGCRVFVKDNTQLTGPKEWPEGWR